MYDAIVVGARCAGSSTAMLLARKGYRVLVVDRAIFPSDTLSSHYIHQAGVAHLRRWGLVDKVRKSNAPPIYSLNFDLGSFALRGSPTPVDGTAEGYGPRRKYLDKILVDAAREAGAEVREGFSVQEILFENGQVRGLKGQARSGKPVTEKARIVIGADGRNSLVARAVGAQMYNVVPTLTTNYYSYWSGIQTDFVELYPRDRRFIVAVPTNDGLTMVTVLWPREEFDRVRSNVEENFLREIDLHAPQLAIRMRAGRREERFYGTGDIPNFFRESYGPGWALVGDAGYHKDPVGAQGITNSFQGAELLVAALDRAFSGKATLMQALSSYQQQRDEKALPIYRHNCQLATLEPPPPAIQEFFYALKSNQYETNRFFGVLAGSVPVDEFYSRENMERIVGVREVIANAA